MNTIFLPLFICLSTLCTPYENVHQAILDLLSEARGRVLIAAYTITDQEICNKLITLSQNGVDVEVITDRTQAAGKYETAALQTMSRYGVKVYIGKSVCSQLIHAKFITIDDMESEDGSYNFTKSANYQDNVIHIDHDPQLAQQLHAYWNQIKADLR